MLPSQIDLFEYMEEQDVQELHLQLSFQLALIYMPLLRPLFIRSIKEMKKRFSRILLFTASARFGDWVIKICRLLVIYQYVNVYRIQPVYSKDETHRVYRYFCDKSYVVTRWEATAVQLMLKKQYSSVYSWGDMQKDSWAQTAVVKIEHKRMEKKSMVMKTYINFDEAGSIIPLQRSAIND